MRRSHYLVVASALAAASEAAAAENRANAAHFWGPVGETVPQLTRAADAAAVHCPLSLLVGYSLDTAARTSTGVPDPSCCEGGKEDLETSTAQKIKEKKRPGLYSAEQVLALAQRLAEQDPRPALATAQALFVEAIARTRAAIGDVRQVGAAIEGARQGADVAAANSGAFHDWISATASAHDRQLEAFAAAGAALVSGGPVRVRVAPNGTPMLQLDDQLPTDRPFPGARARAALIEPALRKALDSSPLQNARLAAKSAFSALKWPIYHGSDARWTDAQEKALYSLVELAAAARKAYTGGVVAMAGSLARDFAGGGDQQESGDNDDVAAPTAGSSML